MPTRHELSVRLETVTPLFLGGADPRGVPELRAPSFRGALRYWLRAALGGVLGDDVAAVRRAEADVFGNASDNDSSASAVSVRIGEIRKEVVDLSANRPGWDYLFWSLRSSGSIQKGNFQGAKQYLRANFGLHLAVRPGVTDPAGRLSKAKAALSLLVNLGGIGSRSRRAGGSLAVVSGEPPYPLELRGSTSDEIARELGQGLTSVRQAISSKQVATLSTAPSFDVLHPLWCRVWVLGVWPTSEQAIEEMGCALRQFRSRREPDVTRVASWFMGNQIDGVERAVFGLPMPVRYRDGPSGFIRARQNQTQARRDQTIDRRASPLWLKVAKSGERSYVGVATLFKSQFLPEGGRLSASGPKAGGPVAPPQGYSLIEEFIAEEFPEAKEVNYA